MVVYLYWVIAFFTLLGLCVWYVRYGDYADADHEDRALFGVIMFLCSGVWPFLIPVVLCYLIGKYDARRNKRNEEKSEPDVL